jgi:hypothetical protein
MDDAMVTATCRHAQQSKVVAIHLEALDHCRVSLVQLRETAHRQGIPAQRLLIPNDGDTLLFGE